MKALEGNLVTLRAPEPEDLEHLYKWENDTDIWHVSNTLTPFSKFVLRQYIENARLDIFETRQVRFMIDIKKDINQKTIGTIDIFDFEPYHNRAGIGILIGDTYERGKGYADDALKTLTRYCFQILKLHQLYCNISEDNIPSLQLFQNNGFEIIGRKKDWICTLEGWTNEFLLQLINTK